MPSPVPMIVLPVKAPALAKSRLTHVAPRRRRALARAFALDALTAARSVAESVVVLTTDEEFAETAVDLGAHAVSDQVPGDLNRSLTAVAATLPPDCFLVALCADLPAVRTEDLRAFLDCAPRDRPSFVADAAGIGTTTYAALAEAFEPRFGPGSAAAHRAAGALEVGAKLHRLRADVDTGDDLERAQGLGVGPHTTTVLAQG